MAACKSICLYCPLETQISGVMQVLILAVFLFFLLVTLLWLLYPCLGLFHFQLVQHKFQILYACLCKNIVSFMSKLNRIMLVLSQLFHT